MDVTKTNKKHDMVHFGGYSYRKDRERKNHVTWRCAQAGCKGRASTPVQYGAGIEPEVTQGHSHAPDPAKLSILKAKEEVVGRALTTHAPPRRLVQDALQGATDEVTARVGSAPFLRQAINRARRASAGHPRAPSSAQAMVIPDSLKSTHLGDPFVLSEAVPGCPHRAVIFGTEESVAWLEAADHWLADGCFDVAPECFLQLYTVHAFTGGFVFPCAYVLMQSKSEQNYDGVWARLKELCPGLSPTTVLTDFESAARNSLKRAFPNASLGGCFFHLGQSVWRKVQNLGLREAYLGSEELRTSIKMMTAVAFLPPDEVVAGFEALQASPHYVEAAAPIYDYFEDTYIGRPVGGGGRRAPRYPVESWNAYVRLEGGAPRTNNNVEAWHQAFQASLSCSHPTPWLLIEALRREESLQRARYNGMIAGENPRKKRKYAAVDSRLKLLVQTRQQRGVVAFLRGVSYNIVVG